MVNLLAWLKRPLPQFFVVGLVLFGLDHSTSESAKPVIRVDADQLQQLRVTYQRQHGREPEARTLQQMITTYLEEEALFREALQQSLHLTDPVVRRRLINSQRYLNETSIPEPQPDNQTLEAFWASHKADYRQPARASFHHVFISAEAHERPADKQPRDRVAQLLQQLQHGKDWRTLGDAFLLGRQFSSKSDVWLGQNFGAAFVQSLEGAEPGQWFGPLSSPFGQHLVMLDSYQASRQLNLNDVESQVKEDWLRDRRRRQQQTIVDRLVSQYTVEIAQSTED